MKVVFAIVLSVLASCAHEPSVHETSQSSIPQVETETSAVVGVETIKPAIPSERLADEKEMLYSKWRLKYPDADFRETELWCQSVPTICNLDSVRGQAEFERKLKDSDRQRSGSVD
jgi:hypothetical protein